jgi:hypothetical protein
MKEAINRKNILNKRAFKACVHCRSRKVSSVTLHLILLGFDVCSRQNASSKELIFNHPVCDAVEKAKTVYFCLADEVDIKLPCLLSKMFENC